VQPDARDDTYDVHKAIRGGFRLKKKKKKKKGENKRFQDATGRGKLFQWNGRFEDPKRIVNGRLNAAGEGEEKTGKVAITEGSVISLERLHDTLKPLEKMKTASERSLPEASGEPKEEKGE